MVCVTRVKNERHVSALVTVVMCSSVTHSPNDILTMAKYFYSRLVVTGSVKYAVLSRDDG